MVFDCDCKSFRVFDGLFLLRALGCPILVFHWSAAWLSWPPLWWGVISFQNFRMPILGLYFCVDFLASSKLIGYLDLTDSYEIWPKCSLIINVQKCVRLFRHFCSLSPTDWHCAVCLVVRASRKAGNSVKQIVSVLRLKACLRLPLNQILKMFIFSDFTFY